MTNTPNFSISKEAYAFNISLSALGIQTLYVFPSEDGFRAQWVEKLLIRAVFDNPVFLRSVRGSGQPFLLIRKSDIPTLDDIISGIRGAS